MNDELKRSKVCPHGAEWQRCDTCSPRAPEHSARSTPECAPLHPDIQMAYDYVESVKDRPDHYSIVHQPLWYGWALREAYLAGMTAARTATAQAITQKQRLAQGREEIALTLERWLQFDERQSDGDTNDQRQVMLNGFENAPPTWPTRAMLKAWIVAIRDGQKPNADEVICPNCAHQFRAIPENAQKMLVEAGATVARYRGAIRWALGYDEGEPEFEPPANEGSRYWWRTVLARRAGDGVRDSATEKVKG